MIIKYRKFFESKKEDIFEDVKNIVFSSLSDLDLTQITDPNLPWGTCDLIMSNFNQSYLNLRNIPGVYAIELCENTIKISIRFGTIKYMSDDRSLVNGCLEELESRLEGENYDWEKRPVIHNDNSLNRYIVYIGKWAHSRDEFGSYHRFISENKRQSGDGSYSNFEGKDNQIMDFFTDLSDEFGLTYFPIPNEMNNMLYAGGNVYLETLESNGGWYLSPNTNKINIKIAFKESYIRENIREFIYYVEELEDRLKSFEWESVCDNRRFGAKHAFKITHHIEKIVNNCRFNDEAISFLENHKNMIPKIFNIDCEVESFSTQISD